MPMDILSAVNAYRNQLKMMQDAGGGNDAQTSAGTGSTFAQMLKEATQGATNATKESEALQLQSLTGSKADQLTDMVTAMTNAELTLNTVVAVRDRVINAYNDIIKMNI